MKCNVGSKDKVIRFILGGAILAAGIYFNNWWGLAGLIFIGTAYISWCPIYAMSGISTCKRSIKVQ